MPSTTHNKTVNGACGWTTLSAASQQSCPLPWRYAFSHAILLGFNMKILFSIFLVILVSGCASTPTTFEIPRSESRVGVMFLADEYPRHEHVGTTVFQNFTIRNASKTEYESSFRNVVAELLEVRGNYVIVNIPKSTYLMGTRNNIYSFWTGSVKTEILNNLSSIAAKEKLDYIIVLRQFAGGAWVDSSAYVDGYGLYTRCAFGSCFAEALGQILPAIYRAKLNTYTGNSKFRYWERKRIDNVDLSGDLKVISDQTINKATDTYLIRFKEQSEKLLRDNQFIE